MTRYATFRSPSRLASTRLQSALYYSRKRRRERISGGSSLLASEDWTSPEFTVSLTNPVEYSSGQLSMSAFFLEQRIFLDQLSDQPVPDQLALNTDPGEIFDGVDIVNVNGEDLDPGDFYLVRYTTSGPGNPFTHPTSPFVNVVGGLPGGFSSSFAFVVQVKSDWSGTGPVAAFKSSGTATTYSNLTIEKCTWRINLSENPQNRDISYRISLGSGFVAGTFQTPIVSGVYVSTTGSDSTGDGSETNPYRTPQFASSQTSPGDIVLFAPGVYDHFDVENSGTSGNPIVYTTRIQDRHKAIIRGELTEDGIDPDGSRLDGVAIFGKTWIVVKGLKIERCSRMGVFIEGDGPGTRAGGASPTITGSHVLDDLLIEITGVSGISIDGRISNDPYGLSDPYPTQNIVIKYNKVTKTNVDTGNNNGGGQAEAITVANGVRFCDCFGNEIFETRQYGIDYKNHVIDGNIYENFVHDVDDYGIYIDSGESNVENINIFNNKIWNCRIGIALAREEDGDDSGDDLILRNIDIINNVIWNIPELGIYFQRHPTKDQQNIGLIRNIRARFNSLFNTNILGTTRDINIDDWASFGTQASNGTIQVVDGVELIGNVIWNPDGSHNCRVNVSGDSRFTVEGNYNIVDGLSVGTDPEYVDPVNGDLRLTGNNVSILNLVSGRNESPFDKDFLKAERQDPSDPGAYEFVSSVSQAGVFSSDFSEDFA